MGKASANRKCVCSRTFPPPPKSAPRSHPSSLHIRPLASRSGMRQNARWLWLQLHNQSVNWEVISPAYKCQSVLAESRTGFSPFSHCVNWNLQCLSNKLCGPLEKDLFGRVVNAKRAPRQRTNSSPMTMNEWKANCRLCHILNGRLIICILWIIHSLIYYNGAIGGVCWFSCLQRVNRRECRLRGERTRSCRVVGRTR